MQPQTLDFDDFISLLPGGGIKVVLSVKPSSPKCRVAGVDPRGIKVEIDTPPQEGRANKRLIQYIAKLLKISKSDISIISGRTSRHKVISIAGDADTLKSRFKAVLKSMG